MKNSKPHIGIFGRRNSGKSSLINLLTRQETAIVSDTPGTTTDPVKKSVEILGIGATVIIDTPGIDDEGELGAQRIKKSIQSIQQVDCAILVVSENRFGSFERDLIQHFTDSETPYFILHNKSDLQKLSSDTRAVINRHSDAKVIEFSTKESRELQDLIDTLKSILPDNTNKNALIDDLVQPKDVVLLITPIDGEAPEGRMILPQSMTIRHALDNSCITVVVKETELEDFLRLGITPALAITDSQVFGTVANILPKEIPLTSFSIIFARLKGDFEAYLKGTRQIARLQDGDEILILESCTHQTSCEDIGRVKLPNLLQKKTGKKLSFTFVSGLDEISPPKSPREGDYALVIQCGGCMATRKQVLNRLQPAIKQNIPVTNYGMTLAYLNGIFERATEVFKDK